MVWDDDVGIWLGSQGWDVESSGGLWHSLDEGESWQRIKGFLSVNSLGLRIEENRKSLVVTERYFDRWAGLLLVPYPSRVVISRDRGRTWKPIDTPPFGARSEIEFTGTLPSGKEVFRVDENLFQQVRIPRWQALRQGRKTNSR